MSMGLLGCLLGCQSNQAVQADREYEITEYEITIAPKTDAWLGGGAARVLALGADGLTSPRCRRLRLSLEAAISSTAMASPLLRVNGRA